MFSLLSTHTLLPLFESERLRLDSFRLDLPPAIPVQFRWSMHTHLVLF